MIGRVRTRLEFATLSRSGNRTAATFLWCNWCLEPAPSQPKVAFAITRSYGSAVKRNRLRRRIRMLLEAADAQHPLPPVAMLFGVRRTVSQRSDATKDSRSAQEQMFEPTFAQVEKDVAALTATIRQWALANAHESNP